MSSSTLSTTQRERIAKATPAVVAFEQELENILLRFAKKINNASDGCYAVTDNTGKRKVNFSKLFKEYKPRLQHQYFIEKLTQIGSFLCSAKAFRMAKFQCFMRYLREISPEFTCIEAVSGYSFEEYKEAFFASGLEDLQAIDTMRVIYEDVMCSYQLLTECDSRLQNPVSVVRCEELLKILRLTTQLALHQESFSWLVYNGTVHIYTISRQMMSIGQSSLVLEYLLWACMCMEASIPLLTLKYLPWRSSLYAAVSLCYLDCKEPQHAESFARRAMKKITELSDIEEISTSVSTPETKAIFQSAKVKINAIIFQRVVFELRKRPKGLLRPKQRPNLKEALHQSWPRSQTERLLSDLFEGSAAQFLAILHTLGDPHRRTLQCKAPTGAIDDITLDIFPELFVAGVDLVCCGNNGSRGSRHEPEVHASCIQLSSMSLLNLSEQGSDGVPLPFVVKFIKLAFSYEQWDVLDVLLQPFITMLKTEPDLDQIPAYIMALELLAGMEPFCSVGRKQKKGVSHMSESGLQENTQGTKSNTPTVDDLLVIANVLCGSSQLPRSCLAYLDVDMMVDAALFLWTRCKPYFQRVVSCNLDSCRQVTNDADCDKWLYLLLTIHNVLHWSGLSDMDPLITGEVALKLALILECRATSSSGVNKIPSMPGLIDSKEQTSDQQQRNTEEHEATQRVTESGDEINSKPYQVAFPSDIVELLHMAFQILEASVDRVGEARDTMEGCFQRNETGENEKTNSSNNSAEAGENAGQLPKSPSQIATEVIHLELLFNLTRLLVKLDANDKGTEVTTDTEKVKTSIKSVRKQQSKKDKPVEESWTVDVIKKYNKRPLTKALLLMRKTRIQGAGPKVAKQQLQECYDLIKKSQTQEKVLESKCKPPVDQDLLPSSAVPPPPILVFRSSSKIILKPAPYQPLTKDKVCWYRIFGCSASGSNVKVRINDADLAGTGEEIPQGPDCIFSISNLSEGEKYVFAVAAYDENGGLLGGGIGPTGHAIRACHTMPVIMAWGYLNQVAYNCSVYDVANSSAQLLWRYFVPDKDNTPEDSIEQLSSNHGQLKLKINRCDVKRLENCNNVLLRYFLQSIFITVDISVQDGKLYCDSLCDYGHLLPGQVNRIKQCEKMLLALQVALWLNDNTLVLQIVTRCYGLLAPLLQLKIPVKPVVQVLLQCYAVLQEIPSLSRYRKHSVTSDSLYHLIAVVTYYLSKVLPLFDEQDLANAIRETGRKLLSIDPPETTWLANTSQPNDEQTAVGSGGNSKPGNKKLTKGKKGGKKTKGGAKSNVKLEQSTKDGSFQKKEFLSLESYYLKWNSDAILTQKNDNELTGAEDPSILASYVEGLNAQEAYKEVIKFKRRTKFLEYFVQVLEKAFTEGCLQKVLDWSSDTQHWLYKRNELLMPIQQKTSFVRAVAERGGHEEAKNKKYAAAIVEYGKPAVKKTPKTTRQQRDSIISDVKPDHSSNSQKATQPVPRFLKKDKIRKKGKTAEEIDIIIAIETMQTKLPEFWKTELRKKKLRSISNEETPWRCQWNILRGVASLENVLKNRKNDSNPSVQDRGAPVMSTEWFGFDVSGVLIPRQKGDDNKETLPVIFSSLQDSQKTSPRKRELSRSDCVPEDLHNVYNAAKYLSQAVVLSYRGKCWGLLQNASCHLWNMKQKLQALVTDSTSFLSEDMLQEVTCLPFYHTADALLDMVFCIQKDKAETLFSRNKPPSSSLPKGITFWGDIEDEKGGSDLIFEDYLDDQSIVDAVWIKRVVMHSMELLFYQNKWEKLADIILRFNVLSRGRYAESVLPVLAIAQQKLHERAKENGGVSNNQPKVEISSETGKPEGLTIATSSYISFDPAVHIDPKGHDVYSEDNDSLRLFSVPTDKTQTLQALKQSLELKHCAAKALQHSRQLLLRYLAGLYEQTKSTSRVGFAPFEDQSVTCLPEDLSVQTFDKISDVQKQPLAPSQLAVVITSYDKTIEMLQFHGRKALLAQAMTEIGNIMLHIGNTRSAFRWWQSVLDSILSNVLSPKPHQQSHNPYHDAVHVSPSILLQKRGIWGCLLGAIIAVNIARYIHTANIDKRLDYCCVAASLLKAIFSSSLPHPTANIDYALYDIGDGFPVGSLIPSVNLFSDPFRCDAKVLLTSTVWLVEELIKTRHYLLVLPLLTLTRYIASDIFDDEMWITKVLLLRTRALTNAGLFAQSYTVLTPLLLGRPAKCQTKNPMTKSQSQNTESFQCNTPVTDTNNIQAITNLISSRLSPDIAAAHGVSHSRSLSLEQARLMIEIASAIYATPLDVKKQLKEKLAGETPLDTSISEMSKTSKPFPFNLFEDDTSTSVIKSYLLAGAELLLKELRDDILGPQKDLRDYLDVRGHEFKPSEFKMLILIELELASIREQYLESLGAAQIVYTCMRNLEDASVILEHDQKRSSSAWTAFSRTSDLNKIQEVIRGELNPVKTELDSHLWLACRMKMIHCLSCEENSLGRIAGFSRSVVAFTRSCEQHCEQGIDEADAFSNAEVVVEFRVMAMLLRLQHGCLSQADFDKFKTVIETLRSLHPLSVKGRILLVKMLIYYGDFVISFGESGDQSDYYYCQAESILREELREFGENLESIQNIHLPHIRLLAEIKLRFGRALTRKTDQSSDANNINEALDVLNGGLTLVRTMKAEQNPLESEFLYLIGKLQHLLWLRGQCSETIVVSSFIDAITMTFDFDHNLKLMKECYEQLSLFYITKTHQLKSEVEEVKSSSNVSPSKLTRGTSKNARRESKDKKLEELKAKRETKKELKAAWVATRAAATITAVLKKRALLVGEVTQLSISKETGLKIPKSAIHDMLGAVSMVVSSEDESCVQDDGLITMDSYVNGTNNVQLTWVHLLSHVSYLQRQVSYQSLGVKTVGYGGPLFRWRKFLKLCQMRQLLSAELDIYVKTCCGVHPSPLLLLTDGKNSDDDLKYLGTNVDEAGEYEISTHWLSAGRLLKRTSNETEREYVQCVYAFNNKAVSSITKTGVFAGTTSVPYESIIEVHEQLQVLAELAETDLAPQPTTKPSKPDINPVSHQSTTAPQTSRKKRNTTMKNLSAHGARGDQTQINLKECLYSLTGMMNQSPLSDKKDIPFEVSLANIRVLESIFDPYCGFIGKVSESFYIWLTSLFL